MGSFTLDLKKFTDKVEKRADLVVKGTILGVHRGVDRRSPVDTGRFRGNWQLGIGSQPGSILETTDKTGVEATLRIASAVPDDAAGRVYFIANNLPYAQRLEDGWSMQAPSGMVGLTMVEAPDIVRDAVAMAKAATP